MSIRFLNRYLLVLCLFSVVYPCSDLAASSLSRPFQIGVLYWSSNIPGQVAMAKGLEDEARRINQNSIANRTRGVKLITRVAGDGPEGIERQIQQMHELIQLKPDAIIVQPTDNAALSIPLQAANQAGIPVIAYDQYISGGQLASYITSDNHQAGYLGGEYIASQFENNKTIRLILVEYPLVSSTVERLNGFLDALRDQKQPYSILKTYVAVEPIAGKKAGNSILNDFPEKGSVDVIFTVNDGGGLSVVDVLAKAGRHEIMVASVDGDLASIENILTQRLTRIDAAQFCGPLGAQAMKTAYAVVNGQDVSKHILIPVYPVTEETIHNYPGWLGPIPRSFNKPWPSLYPTWNERS